jgi:Ras-related protein Rab-35
MQIIKVILIGAVRSGKTSLLQKWSKDNFNDNYVATVSVDFASKELTNDTKVHAWDLAGDERFQSVCATYANKDIEAIIAVFDLSNPKSFASVKGFLEKYQGLIPRKVEVILVGTKSDLVAKEGGRESITDYCAEKGIKHYFETSAKENKNINEVFDTVSTVVLKNRESEPVKQELILPVKPIITESRKLSKLRGELQQKLLKYTERVEGQKNGKSGYSEGFWCIWGPFGLFGYTKTSRAINREANHLLAKELLAELNTPKAISEILANVKGKRNSIISEHRLDEREGYVARDLNCNSELYGMIEDAKKTLSK